MTQALIVRKAGPDAKPTSQSRWTWCRCSAGSFCARVWSAGVGRASSQSPRTSAARIIGVPPKAWELDTATPANCTRLPYSGGSLRCVPASRSSDAHVLGKTSTRSPGEIFLPSFTDYTASRATPATCKSKTAMRRVVSQSAAWTQRGQRLARVLQQAHALTGQLRFGFAGRDDFEGRREGRAWRGASGDEFAGREGAGAA